MTPATVRRLRRLATALGALLLAAALAVGWFYWRLRSSLPQLDGTAAVGGLGAAVTIERDREGVPTLRGANRVDLARALGWLHGQERFFQMDLLRRHAAGELAEVFGERALPRDRATRRHGFRRLAETVLGRLPAGERALLEAYAAGVNAGLGALGARPFEYLVLRDPPAPWRPEDSVLASYAMTLDLQDTDGTYERTLMTLRDRFGLEALAFFAPAATPQDAALDGSSAPLPPVPGPKVIDLRGRRTGATAPHHDSGYAGAWPLAARDPAAVNGSNAFALAGRHTAGGAALLANDMHLDHGVPNIWYRAALDYDGRRITGVTLPGTPAIVAGSNGRVAWGFTNSYADTGDLVVVEINSIARTLYQAPGRDESLKIEKRHELIRVKGAAPVTADYEWTIWGPIVGTNDRERPLAHRWVAYDPAATNFALIDMEGAATVEEGIAVAHRAGIPAQNILLADRSGAIAWTIAGRLPKRVGYDGRLPVAWTFGDRRWDGYLSPAETPVVRGDQSALPGRLWSGNNRMAGGEAFSRIGDGGYARPARAAQIRDDLAGLERAGPRDLLAVQLDDRALFLAPWHRLLLDTLTPDAAGRKPRAALRALAEKWEGRASVEAVSYRIVREFRSAVHARVFTPIFASCVEAFPGFNVSQLQLEAAVWPLLRERPPHLLNPDFAAWDDLLLAAVDDTIAALDRSGRPPPEGTWGWRNRARIRHPFGITFPWLGSWLNFPADPLPGDSDMPRVQAPGHGASERFVVSPGREEEGIFHMPGGQSGHPLSPFYRAGHAAWVQGAPTPFLPGPAAHTLTLRP
jgi:penicillin amidase